MNQDFTNCESYRNDKNIIICKLDPDTVCDDTPDKCIVRLHNDVSVKYDCKDNDNCWRKCSDKEDCWIELWDDSASAKYWYNPFTRSKCSDKEDCWIEYWDEDAQSKYWFNPFTKEATWINKNIPVTKQLTREDIIAQTDPYDIIYKNTNKNGGKKIKKHNKTKKRNNKKTCKGKHKKQNKGKSCKK